MKSIRIVKWKRKKYCYKYPHPVVFEVDGLPPRASDREGITTQARKYLKDKLKVHPIAFRLLDTGSGKRQSDYPNFPFQRADL